MTEGIVEVLAALLVFAAVVTGWIWLIVRFIKTEHPFLALFTLIVGLTIVFFLACF